MDRGRALFSTVDNLRAYFKLLKSVLDEGDFLNRPQDIYNCDETIVDLNKSSQKVVVPRRFKASHSRQVASSEHVTIHCCISAAGNTILPFIIYKAAFPGGNYTAGGPDGALYGKQKTGFMDSELFVKWFTRLFIPHARPTPENGVLLLVDGHSSHCSPDIIKIAKENNVTLLALAPHTTHLCQPLDVAVYKSFKVQLSKLVKLGQALRGDVWVSKSNIARMLKQPFESSMTLQNIKAGFKKCGICPYNPNAIDKSQLFRNKRIPNEDVDLSVFTEESYQPPGNIEAQETFPNIDQSASEAIELVSAPSQDLTQVALEITDGSPTYAENPNPSQNVSTSNSTENLSFGVDNLLESELPFDSINISIVNEDHNITLNIDDPDTLILPASTNVQIPPEAEESKSICIKVYAKSSPIAPYDAAEGSIVLLENTKDAETQTDNDTVARKGATSNPLVTEGIISPDLAEIFYPPDEKILQGRKRPLRTKSQARVMTSQEVINDLNVQEQVIESRTARKEANIQRGRTNCRGKRVNRVNISAKNRERTISNEEDNTCHECETNYYQESQINRRKWVGCETCHHWVCPRCLPPNFNNKTDYYCNECV